MNIILEKMGEQHRGDIMKVFNQYAENGTAAFAPRALPESFYEMLLKRTEGYPAYALVDAERQTAVGFCQLSAYHPLPTFAKTACLTCFIAPEYTGKGLGGICLSQMERDARQMNVKHLIAEVSSENTGSISFHTKHGFAVAGELHQIGEKLGRTFSVVYMEKTL